ncbi:Chain A, Malonyl-coa [Artemisia annua]|uniref:Chain A, Malonyl-coa n=1 Tax=Artemisia annua TaxID=35608 RepID=A0A2U1MTG9_ARTAN|nr:Chain A, Malonyl-coa [Artemisia annua]
MASVPLLTVLEHSQVSPPPNTLGDKSLQLTFFDFFWLTFPPVHNLFFYELPITRTQFTETIVPNIKHSLSITLKYFYPFVGKLIVYPTPTKKPEICYVEGDSVAVTFAECNLDFNELTGNHPRNCEKFFHLVPTLGETTRLSDCIKIALFSVQVTLFPNQGIAIGITNHHSLGDASTRFCFLNAWTSIARSGNDDESFIANGDRPLYDRMANYPILDEPCLKRAKVESFNEDYVTQSLAGPSDKLRATFILTRAVIKQLKNRVSTQLPALEYVSSFTVACAYIWSCIAKSRNDELQLFGIPIDCRAHMKPPIPAAYFGNCVDGCMSIAKTNLLIGKEGFITAAKLLGENLHKTLADYKDGVLKDTMESFSDLVSEGMPTTMTWVSGTPKLRFYDMDFGWGKPKKLETVSIDYNGAISINSCKESNEDLEIGVCVPATQMEDFVRIFDDGLKAYL